jgi:protein subunit release factor B
MFPVSTEKARALSERMQRVGIQEADLQETFVRSRGKGGQNVNKVATCVVLVHRPSGTMVKCQQERSQALNRYRARALLAAKIERQLLGRASAEAQRLAKLRRQKRRRSRRAKEKMLAEKRLRSETKSLRAPVRPGDD